MCLMFEAKTSSDSSLGELIFSTRFVTSNSVEKIFFRSTLKMMEGPPELGEKNAWSDDLIYGLLRILIGLSFKI